MGLCASADDPWPTEPGREQQKPASPAGSGGHVGSPAAASPVHDDAGMVKKSRKKRGTLAMGDSMILRAAKAAADKKKVEHAAASPPPAPPAAPQPRKIPKRGTHGRFELELLEEMAQDAERARASGELSPGTRRSKRVSSVCAMICKYEGCKSMHRRKDGYCPQHAAAAAKAKKKEAAEAAAGGES